MIGRKKSIIGQLEALQQVGLESLNDFPDEDPFPEVELPDRPADDEKWLADGQPEQTLVVDDEKTKILKTDKKK